jgi:predicted nicotinamide N-methyase
MNASTQLHLQEFCFDDITIQSFVPDEAALQRNYAAAIASGGQPGFPFWAKVWPAAIALCRFIAANSDLFINKKVLEFGAGLGLPSLLVSRWATHVTMTDIADEAVLCMQRSIKHNDLQNATASIIDWTHYGNNIISDIVLLSDVNYAANELQTVKQLISSLLSLGITVVLATPERLVAREFIDSLYSFTRNRTWVDVNGSCIHILVLADHDKEN